MATEQTRVERFPTPAYLLYVYEPKHSGLETSTKNKVCRRAGSFHITQWVQFLYYQDPEDGGSW